MSIKDKAAEIRKVLSDEESSKIESLLKDIEQEGKTLNNDLSSIKDDIKSVNAESKSRKLKIRDLETKIEDSGIEIEDLKKKTDHSELTKENEQLKEYKTKVLKTQRTSFIDAFSKIKDHVNFEKTKDRFKIPAEKDGKFDWGSLTDEEMEINVAKLTDLNSLEYFGKIEKRDVDGDRFNREDSKKPTEIKNEKDIENVIAAGFENVLSRGD